MDYNKYTNQKFGMLTFTGKTELMGENRRRAYGTFICDCGKKHITRMDIVLSGDTQSCGCVYEEIRKIVGKQNVSKATAACVKYNKYEIDGNTVTVHLFNSENVMICDIDDWKRLKEYCWYVGSGGYAYAHIKGSNKSMQFHKEVISAQKGNVRDHINRNRLDNRKENLRETSYLVNAVNFTLKRNNTSGYSGVSYDIECAKWKARIRFNNKTYYLGRYDSKADAIKARKAAEDIYFKPLLEGVI